MTRKSYIGTEVTVSFDPDVCQHSGNCTRGLAAVFDAARKPWIDPDRAATEEVVAQVGRCPSGALRIEARGSA